MRRVVRGPVWVRAAADSIDSYWAHDGVTCECSSRGVGDYVRAGLVDSWTRLFVG